MIPAPYQVTLELTTGCNFSCAHCAVSLREYRARVMPKEIAMRVIDDVSQMDPVPGFIQLSGHGESTILPWFSDIYRYARRKLPNATIAIHTNGSKLAELAELLVDGGPAVISVSVDGTGDVHDAMRKKGSFEALVEGLLIIKGMKERSGSPYPVLQFATVVTGKNFEELPKIVYLAQLVGVEVVVAQPLTPYRELGTDQWSYEQLPDGALRFHNAIVNAQRLAMELNIDLHLNFDELLREPETEWHHSGEPGKPMPLPEPPSTLHVLNEPVERHEEPHGCANGNGCANGDGCRHARSDASNCQSAPAGTIFKQCVDPWFTAFVNVHGSLNSCCYRTTDVQENLDKVRFSDIWYNSTGLNQVRRRLQDGTPDEICRVCPYRPAVPSAPYVPDRWQRRARSVG